MQRYIIVSTNTQETLEVPTNFPFETRAASLTRICKAFDLEPLLTMEQEAENILEGFAAFLCRFGADGKMSRLARLLCEKGTKYYLEWLF